MASSHRYHTTTEQHVMLLPHSELYFHESLGLL